MVFKFIHSNYEASVLSMLNYIISTAISLFPSWTSTSLTWCHHYLPARSVTDNNPLFQAMHSMEILYLSSVCLQYSLLITCLDTKYRNLQPLQWCQVSTPINLSTPGLVLAFDWKWFTIMVSNQEQGQSPVLH